jgi:endonuclease/exonuclease/phosphatase family metal-dependent hydrolase
MKKALKIVLYVVLGAAFLFGSFLTYLTFVDFNPTGAEVLYQSPESTPIADTAELTLVSWNLGYSGLSKEMDFFYDGGQQVYPEEAVVQANFQGIKSQMEAFRQADFILLQEVDQSSQRSHYLNQRDSISQLFGDYTSTFGVNYKVPFVIVPVTKPMGKVLSGIQILSKPTPTLSERHSFVGNYAWPKSLFMLDRCFMVNRYPTSNGKELILINTHNEAYDDGGLRTAQMKQLHAFISNEYQQGNYVIVGGDWNQCPPNFEPQFALDKMDYEEKMDIKPNYIAADWKWVFDPSLPTNRRVKAPYTQGTTLTTVIDFFLLSPNVQSVEVKNMDMGFQYSDHQAVRLKVKLIPSVK